MYRVFVYGTLKEGFPNHAHNRGVREAGEFVTVEPYPFYLVGERQVPWLIQCPGEGVPVTGQVYQVDAFVLQLMDDLERVGEPDGYHRNTIVVRHIETSTEQPAFVYFKLPGQLNVDEIRDGPLARYDAKHSARYIARVAEH